MSVYVGIDVHRKRSQVAVIDQDGGVLANRNVPNGVVPILRVIGDLPPGTPAAFEAAFGWGWLVQLLEDYGFEPHLVHPLQLQGDRLGAAAAPGAAGPAADAAAQPDPRASGRSRLRPAGGLLDRPGPGWPRWSCPPSLARSSA